MPTITGTMYSEIFQSTSSVWRTTKPAVEAIGNAFISIHVLRVEDDGCPPRWNPTGWRQKFQSTSSVWRTTWNDTKNTTGVELFQSTSSVWRTTGGRLQNRRHVHISIHVLRVEDDPCRMPSV